MDAFRRAKRANERRTVKMQASEALQILPVMALRVVLVIQRAGRAIDVGSAIIRITEAQYLSWIYTRRISHISSHKESTKL